MNGLMKISGTSGIGKTSMLLHDALIYYKKGKNVLLVSSEQTPESLIQCMARNEGIDSFSELDKFTASFHGKIPKLDIREVSSLQEVWEEVAGGKYDCLYVDGIDLMVEFRNGYFESKIGTFVAAKAQMLKKLNYVVPRLVYTESLRSKLNDMANN